MAGKHYRQGHDAQNRGAQLNDTEPAGAADEQWARAAVHEQVYGERAALVALLAWLRCRWRIQNAFTYLTAHHGIDALADYHADLNPDTTKITNPARVAARKRLTATEAELACAERALSQLLLSDQRHTTDQRRDPGR